MQRKTSLKKVLILVAILAIPGFLYFLLQEKGKNRYRPLPIFGPKQVASTFHTKRGVKVPDTIYHTIEDFKLVNQAGDSVGLPADTTQITIVNFFFSRCKSVCPQINAQLAKVVDAAKENKLIKFYSITVDPEYDTQKVLAAYARQYQADASKWSFLTGERATIYRLARKGFLIDVVRDSTQDSDVVHSSLTILVDPKKRIRGYYDLNQKEQVGKLVDEIKVQITEELREVVDR